MQLTPAIALSLGLLVPFALEDPASPERPDAATLALFDYDREEPLEIEEAAVDYRGGYRFVDLSYASPAGGRVPAYLYEPDGDGPFPGIVLMHGMPGDRDGVKQLAEQYVGAGAAVIAISAPFSRPGRTPQHAVTFTEQDREEQIQLIQDLRRCVDVLEAVGTVDMERVAYVGGSYGGAMGGLLAGVEKRIKAYALMVGDGGLVAHSTGPEVKGGRFYSLPEEQRKAWLAWMEPIEPVRFVGLAAPSALLFQNGKADEFVSPDDARLFQEAGSEPKTVKWYESGHGLTPQLMKDQAEWLAGHIGIDPSGF